MLTKDNVVRLADFGFAKSLSDTTIGRSYAGSPAYMSPEQNKAIDEIDYSTHDFKTDIWFDYF